MTRESFDKINLAAVVYEVHGKDQMRTDDVNAAGSSDNNNQVFKGDAIVEAIAQADIKAINLLMQTMTPEQLKETLEKLSPEERAKYEEAIKSAKAEGYMVDYAAERRSQTATKTNDDRTKQADDAKQQ
jgi:Mg/Co/Ni transporter MgtE